MKKSKFIGLVIAALLGLSTSASADAYKIGTGGETGNYYGMMKDVSSVDYCGHIIGEGNTLEVLKTDGSLDNLTGLLNKKYSIGVVQSDVLMSQAKKDPTNVNINRLKIITALHIEPMHLLVPKNYQPKQDSKGLWGKFTSVFDSNDNKTLEISLDMLKNQDIASWGGSAVSANALSYFFDLNWNIVNVPEDKRDNLSDMPILLVGGQPYKPVEKYLSTGKYILVGLNYKEISNKAVFYVPVELTYSINGKPMSVSSIGVQALMIGKSFRNESKNEPMEKLAQCIDDSLPDLADDPNTNPNWNSVYELNKQGQQLNWSYFKIK